MKLIIGLGNPGAQYENTRHNTGFIALDEIRKTSGFPEFEFNKKFNADVSKGNYEPKTKNQELLLFKPQTFMNLSGESVKNILDFYKLSPADIVVIHDDKDIPLGEYRTADDSSSAGHNGVQNIIDVLGTQNFKRIRIGIGADSQIPTDVFVLQKFTDEESGKIKNVVKELAEKLL